MFGERGKQIFQGIFDRLEQLETDLSQPPPPPHTEAMIAELEARLESQWASLRTAQADLEKRLRDTNVAVSEGIERVERTERRIAATVARARKELREGGLDHPGLEAEARELREVNGAGGDGGGVQPVPRAVEADADEPSSIRGVPASTLRRVRGIG